MKTHAGFFLLLAVVIFAFGMKGVDAQTTTSTTSTTSTESVTATSTDEIATTTLATSTPTAPKEPIEVTNDPVRLLPDTPLTEVKQKRIINLAANISNRMEAMITRLDNIAVRLESRIKKLQSQNLDTTHAETELQNAQEAVTSAMLRISDIDEVVFASVTSESPREDWQLVKDIYMETKDDLVTAKESLVRTVTALQNPAANVEIAESATSSETVE